MACVAVNSLIRTIELEFFQPQPRPILQEKELISYNREFIQSLYEKLEFLMEQLDENRMDGIQAIKELETKLRDVAFRVEDEIELLVVDLYEEADEFGIANLFVEEPQSHRLRHILQQAIEDIDAIKEELVKVRMEYKHVIAVQGRKITVDVIPKSDELVKMDCSSKHASHTEDIMVGKNNEFETIRKKLIEHPSKHREVVSIQGMGGIGKTTLARRVYDDPSIAFHFDKRAWVVASQHHNKLEMLKGLLKSMGCGDNGTEGELAEQLYRNLMRQRYFVVIDDVWSDEAWDAVKACFPDNGNHSRVLLTTRVAEVANHISSNNDFSHQMDLLDQSDSWNLFCEKACISHSAEFETIVKPIVEKCKGLPLAIVVVAGLFYKLNTPHEWMNIAKALNSSTSTTIAEACSTILSLSYNHLSHNLKACFLYLGVFPEDMQIQANFLARLWAAEGLIKAMGNNSFDAVAHRYINELMDRNLVILSELSSCGRKIKWFKMHDLLHAFCVREAQNENLLHVVSENSFDFSQKGFRWVSIQSKDFDTPTILSRSKSCRSFFSFYSQWGGSSLNLKNFNLVRVLYSNGPARFKKIVDIVHLRFLSSTHGFGKNMELSWAWNLQTVHFSQNTPSYIGGNYSEFPQLQYISCKLFHGNPPKFVHKLRWLEPDFCTKEYIMNIPYLKNVYIMGKRGRCNDCITNLVYLEQLEKLCIWGDDRQPPINNHIVHLKNLRKLTICNIRFEWEEINVLSKLPRLEELKFEEMSCVGKEWEIPEEVIFCQLIFLAIEKPYAFKHWRASCHNFPKLERLILSFCYQLREIPIGFAEISTLKSIELSNCLPSAVKSAKLIQDEQRDYGNYNMVLIEKETEEDSKSEESLSEEVSEVDN